MYQMNHFSTNCVPVGNRYDSSVSSLNLVLLNPILEKGLRTRLDGG